MERKEGLEFVEPVTPEQLRHYIEKGNRLRSEAIASALRAAWRAVRNALVTPPAVLHERRERARRRQRLWSGAGLSGDGLPGGAR